ncbi:flagellar hook-basal body complex protein [Pseudodesulfovibrio sp. F-1]|uniref:Flagellar hook protein FlgE n=1 Tax=Pseudodesulfovibrio alkaliphilus TaxID=2661613 RepID=A0A7K1KMF7_9BACT|nr:flagellar hook-basal body complex protein [Pseudodesulfovibrio alkaliphilus]MUM77276.1 flagellar hook-basal body complex protein [Pseudodesulfovibrio alkaliphilus]
MGFSSLFVGATGVVAHGNRMQVVANNLANVSTMGFRRADALFCDAMSRQLASGGGQYESGASYSSQIGMGVAMSAVRNIFTQSGLELTSTSTDLAISGNGFFGVRDPGSEGAAGATHYTRAGAFRFDLDAYLVDPHGFRLQGYVVDRQTGEVSNQVSDVQLPYEDVIIDGQPARVVRSQPRATSSVAMVTNLDAMSGDKHSSETNPFFAMLAAYDGSRADGNPFGDNQPAYSSNLTVYDSEGNERKLSVHFDPVDTSTLSNAVPGYIYWEYLVALPTSADGSDAFNTSSAGLAGMGVLVFTDQGELVEQSAYSLDPGARADGKVLSNWAPASFSADGKPEFSFTYGSNGAAIGEMVTISYDFGLTSRTSSWKPGGATAADVGRNANNLPGMDDARRDARITTSYDQSSFTLFQIQDGHTWGYLLNTSVDKDGFLSGYFSNGQSEQFYQVANYRFTSEWGLRRAGNNHFVSTDASGEAIVGKAGQGGRGFFEQNSLETSNVDMAQEFADMIITQRGYQANTKVITTTDSLLNTLISIKR